MLKRAALLGFFAALIVGTCQAPRKRGGAVVAIAGRVTRDITAPTIRDTMAGAVAAVAITVAAAVVAASVMVGAEAAADAAGAAAGVGGVAGAGGVAGVAMATVVMAMAAMTAMVGKEIAAAIEQPKRARSWLDHKHGRACGPWRPVQRFPAGVSAIGLEVSIRHWIALRYSPA